MEGNDSDEPPQKGDEYRHADGTTEIVFMAEDGRVLTVREYPNIETFDNSVARATYRGVNSDVASLPEAAAFAGPTEATDE